MSTNQPSVLITGANGFVGARLCRKFLNEGFQVFAGVRKSADLSNLDGLGVEFRYGDITEPKTLPEMVTGVDYIVHNAGLTKAKTNDRFFLVNEEGTKSLFTAIYEHNENVRRVVHVSSGAAAGPSAGGRPVTEEDEPRPLTAYGRSKLAGEKAALSFAHRFPVTVVRPPGVYGPGDREIFTFFDTINKRIKPYLGNCGRKIQLVHVDDLCRGIFRAATKPVKSGSVYFISENHAYTMKELIALLVAASGKKAYSLVIPAPLFRLIALLSEAAFRIVGATPMLTLEKARELLESWEMSTEKAKRELNFVSRIPFEQGARETFAWYRQQGWLK